MLEEEFGKLLLRVQQRNCEEQTLEVKAANKGCPERLYDTFSAFANQNEGGMLLFGLDEKQGFAKVGVYDAQDLQKKLMEVGESMTPVVRPVLSVYGEGTMLFVAAEIPHWIWRSAPASKRRGAVSRGLSSGWAMPISL